MGSAVKQHDAFPQVTGRLRPFLLVSRTPDQNYDI